MPNEHAPVRGVFVSYRRDDTSGYAGRLVDSLKSRLPNLPIFMDIDSIRPGQDFSDIIGKAVGRDTVLLALIGKSWLYAAGGTGRRRLDDPGDFVRMEVRSALERGVTVIPVLVQGARMPSAQELPSDLQKLAYRQALSISDERWSYDVSRLAAAIQPSPPPLPAMPPRVIAGPQSWPGAPGQPARPPASQHVGPAPTGSTHKSHPVRNVMIGLAAGIVGVILLITIIAIAARPTPTPSPTPVSAGGGSSTPSPQPTPTAALLWSVKLDHTLDATSYNGFTVTDPSTHFLILFADVQNVSSSELVLGGQVFDLWDNNGQHYPEDSASTPGAKFTVNANQGGTVYFDYVVPNGLCQFHTKVVLASANSDSWDITETPPCD